MNGFDKPPEPMVLLRYIYILSNQVVSPCAAPWLLDICPGVPNFQWQKKNPLFYVDWNILKIIWFQQFQISAISDLTKLETKSGPAAQSSPRLPAPNGPSVTQTFNLQAGNFLNDENHLKLRWHKKIRMAESEKSSWHVWRNPVDRWRMGGG